MSAVALFGLALACCAAGVWVAVRWVIRPLKQADKAVRDALRSPEDVRADVDQCRARRIAETNARLGRVPAAPDNREGTRLDWADEAELIWAAPFDPQAGLDLLRRDIRNQQREEGQQ